MVANPGEFTKIRAEISRLKTLLTASTDNQTTYSRTVLFNFDFHLLCNYFSNSSAIPASGT